MLKNGEAPKKMAIRIKNIAITAALIGRAFWASAKFLDTAAIQIAVVSVHFSRCQSGLGRSTDLRWKILRRLIGPNQPTVSRAESGNAICSTKNPRRDTPTSSYANQKGADRNHQYVFQVLHDPF
jgi:hypothetical protein